MKDYLPGAFGKFVRISYRFICARSLLFAFSNAAVLVVLSFTLQKYKIYPELPNFEGCSVLKSVKILAVFYSLSLSRSKATNDRLKAMQ